MMKFAILNENLEKLLSSFIASSIRIDIHVQFSLKDLTPIFELTIKQAWCKQGFYRINFFVHNIYSSSNIIGGEVSSEAELNDIFDRFQRIAYLKYSKIKTNE